MSQLLEQDPRSLFDPSQVIEKRGIYPEFHDAYEVCLPVENSRQKFEDFGKRIKNLDAVHRLSSQTPWVYWTMEMYSRDNQGGGGLGMLAGDTRETAKKLGVPMTFVTALYPYEQHQLILGYEQKIVKRKVNHEENGFVPDGTVSIKTLYQNSHGRQLVETPLKVLKKREGSVTTFGITEPNLGVLYQGGNSEEHRLYQDVAVGIGGYKLLKERGIKPEVNQMNEAPTVFGVIAELNDRFIEIKNKMLQGNSELRLDEQLPEEIYEHGAFAYALSEIRQKTIYTNHTLVQAVESEFSYDQLERCLAPNLEPKIWNWIVQKLRNNRNSLKLSTLATAVSGMKNGVSRLHAMIASRQFYDEHGRTVHFKDVTNGVVQERWDEEQYELYKKNGVLDEFDLPAADYRGKLLMLDNHELESIHNKKRSELRQLLARRLDQRNDPIVIADSVDENGKKSKIFYWSRRFADYKRPDLLFSRPDELAEVLMSENIHFVISGKVHEDDHEMKNRMRSLFTLIDSHRFQGKHILRERVHYVQDYDEEIAHSLGQGGDAAVNTPIVERDINGNFAKSTEACATSTMKCPRVIKISRPDGFFADAEIKDKQKGREYFPAYLRIEGTNSAEELASVFQLMRRASDIVDERDLETTWGDFIKDQEVELLPIESAARMMAKYLHMAFPQKDEEGNFINWDEEELLKA